jgi:nanoRNase/pAp phosphatase (c-di-AMP/oligoRNAs hydrolase)
MDEPEKETRPRCKYFNKLKELLAKEDLKVAVFAHSVPDPDAIGAFMGVNWLLNKLGIENTCFCSGEISHPQNVALVNLLDPGMIPVSEYKAEDFNFHILVDTVPNNAGAPKDIHWDLVIDHHKENPNGGFDGLFINLGAGSACGTVYDIIKRYSFDFEDGNDYDERVATAMLIGISTDTEHMMSEDTTEYEIEAWRGLLPYRDSDSLRKIVNYERPKFWVTATALAVQKAEVEDGVAVVGMGIIPAKHRDVIADMSSMLVTWEEVHTGIVFALVGGDRIEGSVRSANASVIVAGLCKKLGGHHGQGGGKLGKGAYRYELGGGGIDEDDDEETIQKVWDLYEEKERKRIRRVLNK